ncbi:hypothetical protein [Streptomyces atroolivaceus]|uniref:hypothetical protein n=1 Tax=Streptomyces atroolivaceus TaxID=66869 RepID=UPI003642353D
MAVLHVVHALRAVLTRTEPGVGLAAGVRVEPALGALPRGGFVAFLLASSDVSLRVKGAGSPDEAHPGVRDQGGGFVQRAGDVAVTVGLDLLGTARGDGEKLRDGRHEAAGRVGVLDELAQDRD